MTTKDHSLATGDAVSVRRVCIQADRGGEPIAVDVALPSGATVGELLPAVLGMVDEAVTSDANVHAWRLDRLSGGALDESLSLLDNDVHDGELFILAPVHAPPLGPIRAEPCRGVAGVPPPARDACRSFPGVLCVVATVVASVALAWTGVATNAAVNLVIAAAGACAAVGIALTTSRPTAPSLSAVALAAAAGFLAVPSGPAAPNVFLAAAVGFSASLLMLRLAGRVSEGLVAAATISVLTAVVTLVAFPVVAVGAVLSTASLILLAVAPRVTVLVARLGPEHWADDWSTRVGMGHAVLSGLVAGCAAGATAGVVLVAAAGHGGPTTGSIAFTAMVGAVLLLRTRTYVDSARQVWLYASGLTSGTACLALAAISYPDQVGWVSGVLVVVGLVAVRRPQIGTAVGRVVDVFEYAALAAVIPTACWVSGAFTFVHQAPLL